MERKALFSFPAPTFCETKEDIDCIKALGINMAKLCTLLATPYPEEAANPNEFTKAHNAKKLNCVNNSCKAIGVPILIMPPSSSSRQISFFCNVKGNSFLRIIKTDNNTLTPCAATVAMAAPATFICNPATNKRSPKIFTTHAINTNNNGDLESPIPLNTEEIVLYAVISKKPVPHILMYCTVRSKASSGACIS